MKEPRGGKLVARYKRNYGIPNDANITEEMILAHWELEKRLAGELIRSRRDNRQEVFERCYSDLYGQLEWLNRLIDTDAAVPHSRLHVDWLDLIGAPPKKIFEAGSGKGQLITFLAERGFECRASEITTQRGERHTGEHGNLTWGITDGVHLDRYEAAGSFDVVISNNVIEHLHPDDLLDHFRGAEVVLKAGGRYVFCTPHKFAGPSDISRVFMCDEPVGMHLREYTYSDMKDALKQAGFGEVSAVLIVPGKVSRLAGKRIATKASGAYLNYVLAMERLLSLLPGQRMKRNASRLFKILLFRPSVFVAAQKRQFRRYIKSRAGRRS